MNLKNQLGELFIIGFQGLEIMPDSELDHQLRTLRPGGIILFDRSLSNPEKGGNIQSPAQLKELTTYLHQLSSTPLFICVDQEGGYVQRINSRNGFFDTCSAEDMGRDPTLELIKSEALRTAKTLYDAGINVNFAPVVDLNVNNNNPIIGKIKRSFSSDSEQVIRCAEAWISCHNRYNIISCPKHFPGHGSSATDSHLGFVDISNSWDDRELLPYLQLISGKLADMIMVGHLYNQILDPTFPATLSYLTVSGILRQQLDFNGVIVTDDMQMKAISDHYGFGEAICQSLGAGVDMIVLGNNLDHRAGLLREAIKAVRTGLETGKLSEDTISAALTRIRRLKQFIKG